MDSGPGIPGGPPARASIASIAASAHPKGGSGLGLAIVKAIAERHDARVAPGLRRRPAACSVTVTFPAAALRFI